MIADDMLITGKDEEDHDRILWEVLEHASQAGNCFNVKKISVQATSGVPQVQDSWAGWLLPPRSK